MNIRLLIWHLPENVKRPMRSIRDVFNSIGCRGQGRWCPVCLKEAKRFRKYGVVPRDNACCIHCGALERHRFVWLYLERMTDLFDGYPKRMLHVAPELCFEARLRKSVGDGYVTADLLLPRAMVRMDVTDIQYPDGYFDVVYCSHVFQYVQDDRRAIRECFRVLKQDGWAVLLVPITTSKTFEPIGRPLECSGVFDRLCRKIRTWNEWYGQEDHERRYGPDYVDRLREVGFKVSVSAVSDLFTQDEAERMGLTPACGEIYCCSKIADQLDPSRP